MSYLCSHWPKTPGSQGHDINMPKADGKAEEERA